MWRRKAVGKIFAEGSSTEGENSPVAACARNFPSPTDSLLQKNQGGLKMNIKAATWPKKIRKTRAGAMHKAINQRQPSGTLKIQFSASTSSRS